MSLTKILDALDRFGVSRKIFPDSASRLWALARSLASPAVTYNMPSGPNAMRPPLWTPAAGSPSRMVSASPRLSAPGSPISSKRSTRFSPLAVKYAYR